MFYLLFYYSQEESEITKTIENGYQYPTPENPWKPYEKLPVCSSEIEKEIRELMSIIGTDLLGLAMHIQQVAGNCHQQDSSKENIQGLLLKSGLFLIPFLQTRTLWRGL